MISSLLSPLFSLVNWIVCLVESFFYLVADGIIWAVNIFIVAIAAAVVAILALLPNMPSLPSTPDWSILGSGPSFSTVEGWVAWFWPVDTSVLVLAFIFAAWLIWLPITVLLRWAKVVE